jgi:hypothetical protein
MLRKLWSQGIQIKSYVRYIDDIYLAATSRKKHEGEIFRKVQEELDNLDSKQHSVRVEGKQISASLIHDQGVQETLQGLEFLDAFTEFERGADGNLHIGIGVFRKEAAADMYMAWTSAHSDACKRGLIKGEVIRYLTLCTSEARFDKAWSRFKNALKSRGYSESFIEASRTGLSWETRREVLDRPRKDEDLDRMPIVIQARPKVAEWWQDCVNRGLVNFEGLGEGELRYLKKSIIRCSSGTQKLDGFIRYKPPVDLDLEQDRRNGGWRIEQESQPASSQEGSQPVSSQESRASGGCG